ncbi:(2Fe-2S)-binding protein [Arthrobacter sp. USHLN218]|uniref:(2Fe-2S)-binding protein n=1 Tax=Arthrobacter sp. USHLN218 TaxID=3081232 RepID=UPI00301A9550
MAHRGSSIVCPCHDVTEADIHRVIDQGHTSPETIKRATAAYMGSCQGKYCSKILQDLLVARGVEEPGRNRRPAARAPIVPIPLGALIDPEEH